MRFHIRCIAIEMYWLLVTKFRLSSRAKNFSDNSEITTDWLLISITQIVSAEKYQLLIGWNAKQKHTSKKKSLYCGYVDQRDQV